MITGDETKIESPQILQQFAESIFISSLIPFILYFVTKESKAKEVTKNVTLFTGPYEE